MDTVAGDRSAGLPKQACRRFQNYNGWYAFGTNHDGSVLVGRLRGDETDIPTYWTPENGAQNLTKSK